MPRSIRKDEFFRRYTKIGECWFFAGLINAKGYGTIVYKKQRLYAHRLAYFFTHGTFPDVVRHTCDNPQCIRPDHLLGGTQADNMRDMAERKRARSGSVCKLTQEQMNIILDTSKSLSVAAELAKTSKTTVARIRRNLKTREVPKDDNPL